MLKAYYHLLVRDLRLAFRSRHELANPLIFFVLVVSLFPLAVTPERGIAESNGPGCYLGIGAVVCFIIAGQAVQTGLRGRFAGSADAEPESAGDPGAGQRLARTGC